MVEQQGPRRLSDEEIQSYAGSITSSPSFARIPDVATEPEEPEAWRSRGAVTDVGIGLAQGALRLPGAATGLADIPVALVTGQPYVSQVAEATGRLTGFRPGAAASALQSRKSEEFERQSKAVDAGFEEGIGAGALAVATNPRYLLAGPVAESVPSMLSGAAVARALPATMGVFTRAGIGEGAVMAGQANSGMIERGEADPRTAALTAAGIGLAGGTIGAVGGQLTTRAGFGDIQGMLAGRSATQAVADAAKAPVRGFLSRVAGSAFLEGAQEVPQEGIETMLTNLAEGKPITQGLDRATVEGFFAGAVMGGPAGVFSGRREEAKAKPTPRSPLPDLTTPSQPPAGGAPTAGTPTGAAPTPSVTPTPQTVTPGNIATEGLRAGSVTVKRESLTGLIDVLDVADSPAAPFIPVLREAATKARSKADADSMLVLMGMAANNPAAFADAVVNSPASFGNMLPGTKADRLGRIQDAVEATLGMNPEMADLLPEGYATDLENLDAGKITAANMLEIAAVFDTAYAQHRERRKIQPGTPTDLTTRDAPTAAPAPAADPAAAPTAGADLAPVGDTAVAPTEDTATDEESLVDQWAREIANQATRDAQAFAPVEVAPVGTPSEQFAERLRDAAVVLGIDTKSPKPWMKRILENKPLLGRKNRETHERGLLLIRLRYGLDAEGNVVNPPMTSTQIAAYAAETGDPLLQVTSKGKTAPITAEGARKGFQLLGIKNPIAKRVPKSGNARVMSFEETLPEDSGLAPEDFTAGSGMSVTKDLTSMPRDTSVATNDGDNVPVAAAKRGRQERAGDITMEVLERAEAARKTGAITREQFLSIRDSFNDVMQQLMRDGATLAELNAYGATMMDSIPDPTTMPEVIPAGSTEVAAPRQSETTDRIRANQQEAARVVSDYLGSDPAQAQQRLEVIADSWNQRAANVTQGKVPTFDQLTAAQKLDWALEFVYASYENQGNTDPMDEVFGGMLMDYRRTDNAATKATNQPATTGRPAPETPRIGAAPQPATAQDEASAQQPAGQSVPGQTQPVGAKRTPVIKTKKTRSVKPKAAPTPAAVPPVVESFQPRVSKMPEAVSVGPSSFKPKPIGKTLYRETDPDSLGDLLRSVFADSPEQGAVTRLFVTDDPDLALGQGKNKGARIEFDGNFVSGVEHKKPGTGIIGGREYQTDYVHRDAITRFVLPAGVSLKGAARIFANFHFTKATLGDGTTEYTRKNVGSPAVEPTPEPTPAPPTPRPPRSSFFADDTQQVQRLSQAVPDAFLETLRGWVTMLGMDARVSLTSFTDAGITLDGIPPIAEIDPSLGMTVRKLTRHDYTGQNGIRLNVRAGEEIIALNEKLLTDPAKQQEALETLAHELGHIFDKAVFRNATRIEQSAVLSAYTKWYKSLNRDTTMEAILEAAHPYTLAEGLLNNGGRGQTLGGISDQGYWTSFDEWFANQVARWANSSAQPVSVVDKFFAKVAAQLRKLYASVAGKPWLPAPEFAAFMDRHVEAVRANAGLSPSALQEQFGPKPNLDGIEQSIGNIQGAPSIAEAPMVKAWHAAVDPLIDKLPLKIRSALKQQGRLAKKAAETVSFTHQLVDRYRKYFGTTVDLWWAAVRRRAYEKNAILSELQTIVDPAENLSKNERADVETFLNQSTRSGKWGFKPSWIADVEPDPAMQATFDAMPEQSQQLIRQMFEFGHRIRDTLQAEMKAEMADAHADVLAKLRKRVTDNQEMLRTLPPKSPKRKAIQERIDRGFEMIAREQDSYNDRLEKWEAREFSGKDPYMPLRRWGKIAVVGSSAEFKQAVEDSKSLDPTVAKAGRKRVRELESNIKHRQVSFTDSVIEAEALKEDWTAQGLETDWSERMAHFQENEAIPFALVERLKKQAEGFDSRENTALSEAVQRLYIQMLDDTSIRKTEIRRRNIHGESKQMLHAYIENIQGSAHLLSALRTNRDTFTLLEQLKGIAKDKNAPGTQDQRVLALNDLLSRQRDWMNFKDGWFDRMQGSAMAHTSVWMLLSTPSYYLQNITQPWMMTWPALSAKFSMNKAATTMTQAYRDVARWRDMLSDKRMLSGTLFDVTKVEDLGERRLLESLQNQGLLDIGIEPDLGKFGTAATRPGRFYKARVSEMRHMVRTVEIYNRAVTALSAYRLEAAKATAEGKTPDEVMQRAKDYANVTVQDTQGDYSHINAPSLIERIPTGRLMFQFRKFQLIQLGLLAKTARQWLTGASPEERAVARRYLGFLMGTHAFMGGALGLPMMNLIAPVLAAAFGEEDEPKDFELLVRRGVGDKAVADLLLQGVPSFLGVDLQARLSMSTTTSLLPFADFDLTRDGYQETFTAMFGPAVSLGSQFVDGLGLLAEGEVVLGTAQLMPRGVRDLIRAINLQGEGVRNRSDEELLSPEDISLFDFFSQAIGAPSKRLTDRWKISSLVEDTDTFFSQQSSDLKKRYIRAKEANNTQDIRLVQREWLDLQAARARYGMPRAKMQELESAYKRRKTREASVVAGVPTTRTTRALAEELTR